MRPPTELGTEHVRKWMLHLLQEKHHSGAHRQRRSLGAAVSLRNDHRGGGEVMAKVRSVRTTHTQPDVPSGSMIEALFTHARSVRHRAMFMLLYRAAAAGRGDASPDRR